MIWIDELGSSWPLSCIVTQDHIIQNIIELLHTRRWSPSRVCNDKTIFCKHHRAINHVTNLSRVIDPFPYLVCFASANKKIQFATHKIYSWKSWFYLFIYFIFWRILQILSWLNVEFCLICMASPASFVTRWDISSWISHMWYYEYHHTFDNTNVCDMHLPKDQRKNGWSWDKKPLLVCWTELNCLAFRVFLFEMLKLLYIFCL